MTRKLLLILFITTITFTSCGLEDLLGTGEVTFWHQTGFGHGSIDIYVDGTYEGTIESYYPSGVTCGEGDVNAILSAGSHNWTAETEDGQLTWDGTVYVTADECSTMKLTK